MPPIEANISIYLAGLATTAGDRFFYDTVPQGTDMPYAHIQVISTGKEYTHDGASHKKPRVQISCFGSNHYETKILAQEIEDHMDSLTNCQKAFFENEKHMQNENVKHIAQDYFIWE